VSDLRCQFLHDEGDFRTLVVRWIVNDAVLSVRAASSTGRAIRDECTRADPIAATVGIVGRRADLIVGTLGAYFLLGGGDSEPSLGDFRGLSDEGGLD